MQLKPETSVAWFNLGLALHQQRRIPAAIRAYRQALSLPNAPVSNVLSNLSQDLLLVGCFNEGWEAYEHRLTDPKYDHSFFKSHLGPAWDGPGDTRPCEHLILIAEQGFGDTLQFMRLALLLQRQGITTSLFCQSALIPLLQKQTDLQNVIDNCPISIFQAGSRWCPLMSLPHRLGINQHSIPYKSGYIEVDAKRQSLWRQRLKRKPGHRLIGLHWQGNAEHEQKIYSIGRSFPFQTLRKLNTLKDTEFIAIQKGEGLKQLNLEEGMHFVEGHEEFCKTMEFEDTAAVLANCDLLISSDSGVVHLAGAMGIPCWVALRWIPEWRWGLSGETSNWYESVRLFRQTNNGEWTNVFDQMIKELKS
ncbi:TPR repeat family protein [Synechococcus sp. PROS-U-1]|nr:TPR repeat family protein [Synechococcus sp. PROS-U-1]